MNIDHAQLVFRRINVKIQQMKPMSIHKYTLKQLSVKMIYSQLQNSWYAL